jgi:hypothetical protein
MLREELPAFWTVARVGGIGLGTLWLVLGAALWLLRPDLEDARPPRDTAPRPGAPVGVGISSRGVVTLPSPPATQPTPADPSSSGPEAPGGNDANRTEAGEASPEKQPPTAPASSPESSPPSAEPGAKPPAEQPPPAPPRQRIGVISSPPLPRPPEEPRPPANEP